MAQKATEMLRAALLKSETEAGRAELLAERKRRGRASAEKTVANPVLVRPVDEDKGRLPPCALCGRCCARTPDGLCESCDLAERREGVQQRREHRERECRLRELPPPGWSRVSGGC